MAALPTAVQGFPLALPRVMSPAVRDRVRFRVRVRVRVTTPAVEDLRLPAFREEEVPKLWPAPRSRAMDAASMVGIRVGVGEFELTYQDEAASTADKRSERSSERAREANPSPNPNPNPNPN